LYEKANWEHDAKQEVEEGTLAENMCKQILGEKINRERKR